MHKLQGSFSKTLLIALNVCRPVFNSAQDRYSSVAVVYVVYLIKMDKFSQLQMNMRHVLPITRLHNPVRGTRSAIGETTCWCELHTLYIPGLLLVLPIY